MPHIRMEIHDALRSANDWLRDYDVEVVARASSLDELLDAAPDGVSTAVGKLHPVVGAAIFGAVKAAAADDGRPVYLSWQHGPIQRVQVTAPAAAGLPVDVHIESRYDEDGLTGPSYRSRA